jgi:hypothetical protein
MKSWVKYPITAGVLLATGVWPHTFPGAGYAVPAGILPAWSMAAVNPKSPAAQAFSGTAKRAPGSPSVLDHRRQFALGMIETGNDDSEIGRAGEVSRYQIMPSVWHQYSASRDYRDPATALQVAQRYWSTLYSRFKRQAHREPTDFDMYVMWNTRYGYYAGRGLDPYKLGVNVRDRAQRFVNLTEDGPT